MQQSLDKLKKKNPGPNHEKEQVYKKLKSHLWSELERPYAGRRLDGGGPGTARAPGDRLSRSRHQPHAPWNLQKRVVISWLQKKIFFFLKSFIHFNFSSRIQTHLSNIVVHGLPAHVGVEDAIAVEVPLYSRRPNALKLRKDKNIFR